MRFAYNDPTGRDFRREQRQKQTPAEDILWHEIRAGKLNGIKFRRQYGVGRFILDFYCTTHRLCIELDGGYHQEGYQPRYDDERTGFLKNADIEVLRFKNEQILNELPACLDSIRAELETRKSS